MDNVPQQIEHPPENVLLRYVDGELDAKRAAAIREHLEACWRCRTETEELQETIRDYMHFHKDRILPSIPRPPRYWHGFEGLLNQAAVESAATLRWREWLFAVCEVVPRAVWMGSTVTACAIALIVFFGLTSNRSNITSAGEVLHRAVLSDASRRADPSRRVRIRFRGAAFVRSVGNSSSAKNDAIEPLFRSSRLDWSDPLSARAFVDWHNGLRTKSDHVEFVADRIAVQTRTDEGLLRYARFTVQAADYHPIEESLDFGQLGTVDVSELPGDAEIVARPPGREPKPTLPRPKKIPAPSHLGDDVEANVRYLLHSIGADVREVLSVRRSGDEIEVTGVVSDPDRKQEIVNLVGSLDHVSTQIQSPQDPAAEAPSLHPTPLGQGSGANYDAPAKQWLEDHFTKGVDREAFVHRALQLDEGISVRAYALAQLAKRYPPATFSTLSPSARAQIVEIIADLANGINSNEEALRAHLRPLVTTSSAESPVAPWQAAGAHCLTVERGIDETLARLFAASPERPNEFTSLVDQLQSELSEACQIQVE